MFSGCFKEGFTNKLHGKCECEGAVLFCKDHLSEHVEKPASKGHQCLRLYFKPLEEIKQPVKKDIKKYKTETIIDANKMIKNFKTSFEAYLDIATENDMEYALKLNAWDIRSRIAEWDIKCSLSYQEINRAISKIYEIPFKVTFRIALLDDSIIESNELSFFRAGSSNFVTINLDNFQTSTATLPIQEPISNHITSCILPDKTYFYCCNTNNSGLTFTVDRNKNVKQLQKSKVAPYLAAVFHNNFIYLFGGNLAERYDFKQNVWESLAPLPQSLNFYCSCSALYKDSILISGHSLQKIIIYRVPENSYQEVPNLVLNSGFKFMLRGNNRVYLFETGGRIFESGEENILSWSHIGNNSIPSEINRSDAVRYKGCVYFVHYTNQLWKFDLSSKQASLIVSL